jgi:hypothetical protein
MSGNPVLTPTTIGVPATDMGVQAMTSRMFARREKKQPHAFPARGHGGQKPFHAGCGVVVPWNVALVPGPPGLRSVVRTPRQKSVLGTVESALGKQPSPAAQQADRGDEA